MSSLGFMVALAKKHWAKATTETKPMVFTKTPLADLTQRSLVEIESVPLILAESAGSFINRPLDSTSKDTELNKIRDIGAHQSVVGISKMRYIGSDFYRAYLSKDAGSFIHLGVNPANGHIDECRIYQPYNEIIPVYKDRVEQVEKVPVVPYWRSGDTDYPVIVSAEDYLHEGVVYVYVTYSDADGEHRTGVPKEQVLYFQDIDESLDWDFWLLDNPDPNVGGLIGCPTMQGKAVDGGIEYIRTWVASNARIDPVVVQERIVDADGETTVINHTMMHYSRQIDDKFEYFLVDAMEIPGEALPSVVQYVGLDVPVANIKIFAVSAG